MPNIKSAEKRLRQSAVRSERNKPVRTRARGTVRAAVAAIQSGAGNAMEQVTAAASALDRAARKGVIHRNAAARRKSRLMRQALRVEAAPPEPPVAEKAPRKRRTAAKPKVGA